MRIDFIAALLGTAIVCTAPAVASPTTFTYQGQLDQDGTPAEGAHEFEIRLLDNLGVQIGMTQTASEIVTAGSFSMEIDFGNGAFDEDARYLEISVRSVADGGAYVVLSPNQLVTSAPVAQFALNGNEGPVGPVGPQGDQGIQGNAGTDGSDGSTGTEGPQGTQGPQGIQGDPGTDGTNGAPGDSHWSLNGSTTYYTAGSVGIGTNSPVYPLQVHSIGTRAISASNSHASGSGVQGIATASTGTTYGGRFESLSTAGRGVYGEASASTGFTFGGWFESRSTDGRAIYARASATTGPTYGLLSQSFSTSGYGVYGEALAGTGTNYGGRFVSYSTSGRGLYGFANASTGTTYGVIGRTSSPAGFDFYASGAGTNYGASSSRRWKNNVVQINDPLKKLAQLRGVYYDWDQEHGGSHDVGMIAEEVGIVMPEIVQYEENGIDAIGMDYSKMAPLLVEAVNALRLEKDAEIDQLRSENEVLKDRLDRLERMMVLIVDK